MNKRKDEGVFIKNGQKSSLHCLVEEIRKPGICADYHYHEYIEILYGIDCDISVWADDRIEKFKSGDICFINPGETHFMYSEKENNKYYVIKFSPEILYYDGQMLSELKCLMPVICKNFGFNYVIPQSLLQGTAVNSIVEEIFTEWEQEEGGYEFAIRGRILMLFSIILRVWEKSIGEKIFLSASDENIRIIHDAANYIAENFDIVTGRQMARASHMSYSHFSRMFKKVMGRSFSQFVADARIDEAKRLLLTTPATVTEISQRTGFSSSSHFISSFKLRTGMTPNNYKSNFKRNVHKNTIEKDNKQNGN